MAQQELKLKVGADVGEAVGGMKKVTSEADRMALAFKKADAAAAKSKTNFTGLSRVIQDLPFGFIAISNNLEQLLPAAGGAGLALSALTAALSFAAVGFGAWTRGFASADEKIKAHAKAVKEAKEALDEYVDSLSDIEQGHIRGAQAANNELGSLKTLYDATQNQNISLADRKKLVDELQEQYPAYFGNIKDETILAGGAANAYAKLANNILAASTAQSLRKSLDVLSDEDVVLRKKFNDALAAGNTQFQKTLKLMSAIDDVNQKAAKNKDLVAGVVGGLAQNEVTRQREAIDKPINELGKLLQENFKARDAIQQQINSIIQKDPLSLINLGKNLPKAAKDKKEVFHFHAAIDEPTHNEIHKIATEVGQNFSADFKTAVEESPEMKQFVLDVVGSISSVRNAGNKLGGEMGTAFGDVFQTKVGAAVASGMNIEQLEKFQGALEATMVAGAELADVLGNAFGAFGNALVTGQNALQAFFGSVKSALGQLIGQLIKTVAIAAILSAITGGAGGGGLSFIGAFKSLLSVKPFAKGGLAFGPAIGLVGEGRNISKSNPEVISPLSDLKKFIGGGQQQTQPALFHRISGADLLLWMARANASGGRQG